LPAWHQARWSILTSIWVSDLRSSRTTGSLAAREVGIRLLAEMGAIALLDRRPGGPAAFPQGYVGSIAHDSAYAVVALASRSNVAAVGIDIEPATRLPSECFETVATPRERGRIRDLVEARLLFCAKEAVFKAMNSEAGAWLEHPDVEVDIDSETAIAVGMIPLELRLSRGPTLLALAVLPPSVGQYS
jgi:4'-phosphopantetheinyl transferase EntD